MHWQVQEAKQRFSHVIRCAHDDGPQYVTRHGQEVAVVLDIDEYRRLTRHSVELKDHLLSRTSTAELEIERLRDTGRDPDLSRLQ